MHLQLPMPESESVPGNRALSAGDEEPWKRYGDFAKRVADTPVGF